MTNYRRNFVSGGSFFFTANLADRHQQLFTEHVDSLRDAFRYARSRHPFTLEAIVVLPDHLHAVWTLPKDDFDFAMRWRLIKSAFSRALPGGERISASRRGKGERGIWQRRYWEHTLRDERDFARHLDYIHFNPVKHGYVSRVMDWDVLYDARMIVSLAALRRDIIASIYGSTGYLSHLRSNQDARYKFTNCMRQYAPP